MALESVLFTGLGAATTPLIIHLLNRTRFKVRDWAAMKFLLESVQKNRRRLQLEELILLLLRTLIIVLLTLGIWSLRGCEYDPLKNQGPVTESSTVVFILDDSFSMDQKLGKETLWARARDKMVELLGQVRKGDNLSILLASRPSEKDAFFRPQELTDPDRLKSRLESLSVSDARANLPEALRVAESIFQGKSGARRLFLLSDFRRSDFDETNTKELREVVARLRKDKIQMAAFDFGTAARRNLTIEKLVQTDRFVVSQKPVTLAVTVRNNGASDSGKVKVSLSVRRRVGTSFRESKLPAAYLDNVPAGKTATLKVQHQFASAGAAVITAELVADDLPGDNTANLALDIRPAVKVLLVQTTASVDPRDSDALNVQVGLDPTGNADSGYQPVVRTGAELAGVDLSDYDLIFLLNVRQFPYRRSEIAGGRQYICPQLEALEKYVRDGGGLVIFTGDEINLRFYNDLMYAKGSGLSPFPIRAAREAPRFFRMAPQSIVDHPILATFEGELRELTHMIRFSKITPAQEIDVAPERTDVGKPRILARFDDPDASPAIVERAFGKGRVVMYYSTASRAWNDWPLDTFGSFVLMIRDLVPYMAREHNADFTRRVGDPLVVDVPGEYRGMEGALALYPDVDLPRVTPRRPIDDTVARLNQLAETLPSAQADDLRTAVRRIENILERGSLDSSQDRVDLTAAVTKTQDVLVALESLDTPSSAPSDAPTSAPAASARRHNKTYARLSEELARPISAQLQYRVRWDDIRDAGFYIFEMRAKNNPFGRMPRLFAWNVDPEEGRLSPAGEQGIYDAFGGSDGLIYFGLETTAEADMDSGLSKPYWLAALIAMVALMALETFLAQRFGHYS